MATPPLIVVVDSFETLTGGEDQVHGGQKTGAGAGRRNLGVQIRKQSGDQGHMHCVLRESHIVRQVILRSRSEPALAQQRLLKILRCLGI